MRTACAGSSNLFGTYRSERQETLTQRRDGSAFGLVDYRTKARTSSTDLLLTATGSPISLPSGPVQLTLGAGLSRDTLSALNSSPGSQRSSSFAQTIRTISAGITVPITSRDRGVLPFVGDLAASAEISYADASGFGGITNRTYSLVWQPAPRLRLQASLSRGDTPPQFASLSDPILETPGIRYFDPLRSETAEVTQISGGTPELGLQRGTTRLASISYKPLHGVNLRFSGEYRKISNRNIVSALPQGSAAVLAAFPRRFIRDANGILVAVDIRPVTFARQSQEQIRLGANLVLPLGGKGGFTESGDASADGEERKADRTNPRLQLNLNYTRVLNSELLLANGQAPIDLLSPGAVAFAGVTPPKHQIDFTAGFSQRGFGVRLSGQVRSASYLSIAGVTPDVLRFEPLTILSARAFADGQAIFGDAEWAKGLRFSLTIGNTTGARQKVVDIRGQTPIAYQPAYRDPVGRTIGFEIRKVF